MALIHGTNFNDNNTRQGIFPFDAVYAQINGTSSADTIYGLAGDDIILGGSGNDVMFGDRSSTTRMSVGFHGKDVMRGGAGNDSIYGDSGDDALYGEADNDRLYGGDGNDRLYGGSNTSSGIDRLYGEAGNDILVGDDSEWSGGTDHLYGGSGNDQLFGRAGNDLLQGQSSSNWGSRLEKDALTGGLGSDTFRVAGLYKHGGDNDYAHIKDWNQGGSQDKLDTTDANVALFQIDANTFKVYQITPALLGGLNQELVAIVDSSVLTNQALSNNIMGNIV